MELVCRVAEGDAGEPEDQIIGFKITLVSTGIGLIASNPDKIQGTLLVIPAFAAMFFDLLIASYSFSIKRIGHYCRNHLEKRIRSSCSLPPDFLLWHEFLRDPRARQNLSHFGNLGITVLALVPAVLALCAPFRPWSSVPLLAALVGLFLYDFRAHLPPWKFKDDETKKVTAG